jgi:hypothetical protein
VVAEVVAGQVVDPDAVTVEVSQRDRDELPLHERAREVKRSREERAVLGDDRADDDHGHVRTGTGPAHGLVRSG